MEDGAAADVALVDGRARAELLRLDLVVEDVAEVDVRRRDDRVRDDALLARVRLVAAVERARVVVLVGDSVEDVADVGGGVVAEVIGEDLRVAVRADVVGRDLGEVLALLVAASFVSASGRWFIRTRTQSR